MDRRVYLYFQNMSDFLQGMSHKPVRPNFIQSTVEVGVTNWYCFLLSSAIGCFLFFLLVCLFICFFYFYLRNAEEVFLLEKHTMLSVLSYRMMHGCSSEDRNLYEQQHFTACQEP